MSIKKHVKTHNLQLLADIRALMKQNKSSEQIMSLLHIPLRSYRRYTSKIYKQNQKAWYSLVRDELETELLALRFSFNETFTIAREIALDPSNKVEERLQALTVKDQSRLNLIQLLTEGIELQKEHEVKYHKVGQDRLMMQPHP